MQLAPAHARAHPPPLHVSSQVDPAAHRWSQPPPEHVNSHVAPAAHAWLQPPPEHVAEHASVHATVQPPPEHVCAPRSPATSARTSCSTSWASTSTAGTGDDLPVHMQSSRDSSRGERDIGPPV